MHFRMSKGFILMAKHVATKISPLHSRNLEEKITQIEAYSLFILSVRICHLLPCLWTAASICASTLKISPLVRLHPRAVLPYQPQRVQDLPDIQGEQ